MVRMISRKKSMESVIAKIRADFPDLSFVAGTAHCWSPKDREIFYDIAADGEGLWGLLHELGHAHLNHTSYSSDIDLLSKEVLAWEEASRIGLSYGIQIEREYIEDCLDTYRDWLYKRSTCPKCSAKGLQISHATYSCLSCRSEWHVTSSRFCRPYRLSQTQKTGAKAPVP